MEIVVNYWAVLIAAVVNIVLGFLWYGPLFGKTWMSLMGFTSESMSAQKAKGMGKSYALMTVGSLLMSYVLYHAYLFGYTYTGIGGVAGGVMVGFYYWLGIVVPVTLGTVLWEGKPWKLWILNASYYLVTMMLMGIVFAYMLPV